MTLHSLPGADGGLEFADIETEARLLAIFMAAPDTIVEVAASHDLDGDHFVRPAHRMIYGAVRRLYLADQVVDESTVYVELGRTGELGRAGGAPYLHRIVEGYTTAGQAGYYATHLCDLYRRRRALEATARAAQQLAKPDAPVAGTLGRLAADLEAIEHGGPGAEVSSWTPVDVKAVLAGESVVPDPAILARVDGRHLIYPGKMHTFQGESESLKSWLLQWACAQQIGDGEVALYLDFEDDAASVVGRLLAMGATPGAIADLFVYVRPADPVTPRDVKALAALRPSLAVIDGVTEAMVLHGLSPDSNPDVAAFFALFPRPLADAGVAVAMIDHVTKDKETRGRWAIGAQHKMAGINGASFTVEMTEPFGIGKHGIASIKISKDRLGPLRGMQDEQKRVAELHLQSEDDGAVTAQLRPPFDDNKPSSGFRPTIQMERISIYLETIKGAEISGRTIEMSVSGRADYLRQALELLALEGYTATRREGRAVKHRSLRPYRRPAEEAPPDVPEHWSDRERDR